MFLGCNSERIERALSCRRYSRKQIARCNSERIESIDHSAVSGETLHLDATQKELKGTRSPAPPPLRLENRRCNSERIERCLQSLSCQPALGDATQKELKALYKFFDCFSYLWMSLDATQKELKVKPSSYTIQFLLQGADATQKELKVP